jgi:hypothetical protein
MTARTVVVLYHISSKMQNNKLWAQTMRPGKCQKSHGETSGKRSEWRMVGIWFFTKTAAQDRSSVR